MRTIFAFCILVLLAGPLPARADQFAEFKRDGVTIEIHARETANLLYHLDCLAELISCSDAFRNLWQGELGATDADWRRIDEWKAVRKAVQMREGTPPPSFKIKSSLPIAPPFDDVPWNKVRWAGFVSSDAELERAWAPHASAEQVAAMRGVIKHFEPRFRQWWAANEATAASILPSMSAAMDKGRVFELLAAASRFYGTQLREQRMFVHLMVLPKIKWTRTTAERIGPHLPVEIVPGESVDERVPIIVHELMHHVFGSMPIERQAALIDQITAMGADGVPAWNLLDEVQATAIGNIITSRNLMGVEKFQKLLDKPGSFYSQGAIDLGARATYQLFDQALADGGAMPDSFAQRYVEALRKGLGARLQTPALVLKSMALNIDPEDMDRFDDLRRAVRASSIWTIDPLGSDEFISRLDTYPALSAAVLVRFDRVGKLAGMARAIGVTPDELTKALGTSGGVIFVAKRTAQAYAFVFVVREAAAFSALIPGFKTCTLAPGVCHRIP